MRSILVTGASGFLGHELLKRIDTSQVRAVARNEGKLIALKEEYPDIEIITGDIANPWIAQRAMDGIDMVFHLAAYKHVGMAEENVYQCVESNVIGLANLLSESFKTRPATFVFISTDKTSKVSGIYGATKLIGEGLVREASKMNLHTKYRTVKYGNIIKSTGSFLTKWEPKMRKGEEVVITDPNATRFFWPIEQAVDLIFDAIENAPDCEPWCPSMKAISMGDALKACQEVWGNCPVREIGLQRGENLHEEINGISSKDVEQFTIEEFKKFL